MIKLDAKTKGIIKPKPNHKLKTIDKNNYELE